MTSPANGIRRSSVDPNGLADRATFPVTRRTIYYWKCDRPASLHGVRRPATERSMPDGLPQLLTESLGSDLRLEPAGGQGNHLTFFLECPKGAGFVRVEDGPEGDTYLEVESRLLQEVARLGVPAPQPWFTDVSRQRVPYSVQVIERFHAPDLASWHRRGELDLAATATEIGRAVATWQAVSPHGFGPIDPASLHSPDGLRGWHESYAAYFHLRLDAHLARLASSGFLSGSETRKIADVIAAHRELLDLSTGCLVHKDLALWNILGTPTEIQAFIDWDDAISGDPLDDLSLLGCFYSAGIVERAMAGYVSRRPLPEAFEQRFWLHLIRNLIVKAVIRINAGYFEQKSGAAFLLAAGQDGPALRQFTRDRLLRAVRGLAENRPVADLDE